jgi:tetratricopeptide (TPR) repeat protein
MKLYKDKFLLIPGLLAGFFSFITYFLTKAPTVSFWDCGEFIACCKILGIPHPPGTPLYILLGRLFTMIPFPFNDAVRVNFISVLFSAASVFVAYWLIIRLVVGFTEQKFTVFKKFALAIGGLSGSLIMGFSSTYWDNAIEAEVYGPAMFLMLVLCYLLLLWSNKIGKPSSGKYLVAIAYFSFLSIGIHLAAFMVVPILFIYMLIADRSLLTDYKFILTWLVLLTITVSFSIFFWGIVGLFIVLGGVAFIKSKTPYRWLLAISITGAAAIGFSTHAYIPIRAAEKPAINENNPDSWSRFKGFLDRKQYGQELMVTRALTRRGTWENQFGTYQHMGFWGFFQEQYSILTYAFIFFALGLWGIIESIRRHLLNGLWLLTLFLISTIGLIFYLNFSDGTMGAILEVRNRDYFFTPGFMLFAIFIGIGIANLLSDIANWVASRNIRKFIFVALALLALLLPIHTLRANYSTHDRSRNWIPWDYAYNLLISPDKNAVLFTNGDNDTFPLWFLQQVENVRPDVKVVNLSLLNTPWYIHQLKDQMGVPINMTYDQIENLRAYWLPDKQNIWRVQDEMIKHIITVNNGKLPIYFAMTVPAENRMGLESNMVLEGFTLRLTSEKLGQRVNPDVTYRRLLDEFKYRGLGDSTVHKDENDDRLVANYLLAFMQLADTLKNSGQIDKAKIAMEKAISIYPKEWRAKAYLAGLYAITGQLEGIERLASGLTDSEKERVYVNTAQELLLKQRYAEACPLLKQALIYNPQSEMAFKNLIIAESMSNNPIVADSLVKTYRNVFRGNSKALAALDKVLLAIQREKQN